jgi:hypothetical protein
MSVRFHLFDACDEIAPDDRRAVLSALEAALPRISARLPLDRLDIVIGYSDTLWTIPAYGVGAHAHGKGRIAIMLAPQHPRFADPERGDRLASVLAHEWHHIARARGPGYGLTLGESLVSEGLAQCFEVEMGYPLPPYAVALDDETLGAFADSARDYLDEEDYDHSAWFFGRADEPAFPSHGGYSLGYALVKAWLAQEHTTASAAVGVDSADVIEGWRSGRIGVG